MNLGKMIKQTFGDLFDYVDKKPTISLLVGIVVLLIINKLSSTILTAFLIVFGVYFIIRKVKQ